jgi:hypothetical protein
MAGEEGWSVGARVTEGNKHRILKVRDLTSEEAEALKVDFRHVHDLADLDGFARVLESGNRWKALLDKAEKESDEDGSISAQTHAAARSELSAFTHLYGRLLDEMSLAGRRACHRDRGGPGILRPMRSAPPSRPICITR